MIYQYEPLAEEYQFQIFLKDLFNAIYHCQTFEEFGSKGHAQHGIDIYNPHLEIALQAKKKDMHRSQRVIVKELLTDLSATLKQVQSFPYRIRRLYFATTTKKYLAVQKACIEASQIQGIEVIFFCWEDIQLKLSSFPMVRNHYFPHLKEAAISSDITLTEQIQKLEALILELGHGSSPTKKQYRDIPYSDILLPQMPPEHQNTLTAMILKIALFQTFAKVKYRKFRCLFNYSRSYTRFEDGTSAPGFEVICGEIKFLANCTRLIKTLQHDPDRFWEQLDQYRTDEDFTYIKLKMEMLPIEGLTCYDFEIDGQSGYYYVKVKRYEDLEYTRLDSLSAVLPFIAASTKPRINVIDLDLITKHSAFMKLLHHILTENSFKRSLLKVNVDDFEDWDFDYHPNEKLF